MFKGIAFALNACFINLSHLTPRRPITERKLDLEFSNHPIVFIKVHRLTREMKA